MGGDWEVGDLGSSRTFRDVGVLGELGGRNRGENGGRKEVDVLIVRRRGNIIFRKGFERTNITGKEPSRN